MGLSSTNQGGNAWCLLTEAAVEPEGWASEVPADERGSQGRGDTEAPKFGTPHSHLALGSSSQLPLTQRPSDVLSNKWVPISKVLQVLCVRPLN